MTAAYIGIGVTKATSLSGFATTRVSDPNGPITTAQGAALTTVTGNVATLVADGATPTQAHVNTLNTNHATLQTAVNAVKLHTADVILLYNPATILTHGALDAAIRQLLQLSQQDGSLTA